MPDLIAVDPGTRDVAVARFEGGMFAGCYLLRSSAPTLSGRIEDMTKEFYDFWPEPRKIVVEVPQVYRQQHGDKKVDPDDLIMLSLVAGAFLAFGRPGIVRRPREWKGQLPKPVCHRRIWRALSDWEQGNLNTDISAVPKGLRHNLLDAVGIGLHDLGRLVLR